MDLDKEQLDLLSDLVEASRTLPRDKRQEFVVFKIEQAGIGRVHIRHPGLTSQYEAHQPDLDLLERAGLIAVRRPNSNLSFLSVTPPGFHRYEEVKHATGMPMERVDVEVRKYLDSRRFRQQYPAAYEKWALAEGLLWGEDSAEQLSTAGHHCREALQQFTSVLVERHKPAAVEPDPKKTINRLQAVLREVPASLGTTEADFLKALVDYWRAVDGLVQRQEHAGQKEGRPVVWEDARRVVFQTICVMYEVDRALGNVPKR